jgi:adenylate kinase family enzyme
MVMPIVLLSGPVGAGKSTVARELIKILPGPAVYIEGDTFWSFVVKRSVDAKNIKNFKMIMTSMVAAAVPYALYGNEVILDFSIPPWFLDTAQAVVKVKDVPLDFVVLRPSLAVCVERSAGRAEGAIADYAPYRDLYSSFDEAERYIIQDDKGDAASVASRILAGLDGGKFRLS